MQTLLLFFEDINVDYFLVLIWLIKYHFPFASEPYQQHHNHCGLQSLVLILSAGSYQCGVDEAVCGGPGLRRDEAV